MSTDEAASVFASLLRRHRLAAGLTQEDLAERAGLSARGISDLERGLKRPRMDTVALLVRALPFDDAARAAFERASRRARLLPGEQVAPVRSAAPADLPTGGYLGAVPSLPLVARQGELAQVLAALEAGRPGGSRLLVLAGDPGVGKTRLAQEVLLQVRAAGWLTLVGRCYEEHQRTPYYPFRDVLAAAWDAASPALRERAAERFAALGRLLPEVLPAPAVAEDEEARLRLLRAVAGFVESLAEDRPVLVLLDDLHWADQASLDLLRHLVRFARGVQLLGTYRDAEVGRRHPFEEVLSQLRREQLVDTLPLLPLTAEGTAALIAAQVGPDGLTTEQRDAIHRHAAGNPFFTTELVAVLRGHDAAAAATRGAALPLSLPESVRSVVEQRVGRLAPAAQETLRLASVLGQEFDLEVLLAASAGDEEALLTHIDAALAARLLEERRVGESERLAFSHALIAQALYEEVPRYRLRRLHLHVAGTVERLRGGEAGAAAELGRHYLAGGEPARAAMYLERAGDHARAQQGRAAAEGCYLEAVALLDRLSSPVDAARVREKLGAVLHAGDRYDAALAAFEPAAETYRAQGDLEASGRVAAIAEVYGSLGAPGEGLARVQPLLTVLALRGASQAVAALYFAQGLLLGAQGRFHEQCAAAEEGVRICRVLGDQQQLGAALLLRGAAAFHQWRLAEAAQTLSEAMQVAEAAGDRAILILCRAANGIGAVLEEQGSFAASRQSQERTMQLVQRQGLRSAEAVLISAQGWTYFLSGEWVTTRARFEQAFAIAREIGPSLADYVLHHNLGALCLAQGAEAEAEPHLMACDRLLAAGTVSSTAVRFHLPRILAERDLLAGQPEQAHSRLTQALDGLAPDAVERLPLLHVLAWALHDLGQVEAAAALAAQAVAMARDLGARLLLADTLRVAALIAVRQRRWEAAETALQEGLSLARAMGYPYGEARLLQVAGDLYVQTGQPDMARARLEAALLVARRLGARRVEQQAQHLISALS